MPQLRVSKTNEQNALLRYKFNFDLNAARCFCSAIDAAKKKEDNKITGDGGGAGAGSCPGNVAG